MVLFLGLRCCECNQFCVQQETKNRKWSCKVCSTKQSIVKVYVSGTSASVVRESVQHLGLSFGLLQSNASEAASNYESYHHPPSLAPPLSSSSSSTTILESTKIGNSWAEFEDIDGAPKETKSTLEHGGYVNSNSTSSSGKTYVTSLPELVGGKKTPRIIEARPPSSSSSSSSPTFSAPGASSSSSSLALPAKRVRLKDENNASNAVESSSIKPSSESLYTANSQPAPTGVVEKVYTTTSEGSSAEKTAPPLDEVATNKKKDPVIGSAWDDFL